jgi:threonine/homoserine/homoserine lactone efflux protein
MDLIDPRFAAFVGVSAVLIVTPGPDMALVTRNALTGGWRAAGVTACGVGIGSLVWAMAAAPGLRLAVERR